MLSLGDSESEMFETAEAGSSADAADELLTDVEVARAGAEAPGQCERPAREKAPGHGERRQGRRPRARLRGRQGPRPRAMSIVVVV